MNIEQLKIVKKKKHMTLQEISELSGIPKRTVDDIFSGHTKNPRIDTMKAIEEALGLSSSNLQWTKEELAQGVGNHPTVLSSEEWEILDLFNDVKRIKGEAYYNALIKMIRLSIENKN